MALRLDNVPDPTAAEPIPAAYCKVALIALDVLTGAGRVEVATFRDAAAAGAGRAPVSRAGQALGAPATIGGLTPGPGQAGTFPSLADYMADPQFAAAYNVIRAKLYGDLKRLPQFAGSVDV